jgi:hypothetical protein
MKNTFLFLIAFFFLSINSFSQKSKKYTDYIVKNDTIWCKVLWHNDSLINYTDRISDLMGYNPQTVKKSSLKGYKIVSSDAILYKSTHENKSESLIEPEYMVFTAGDYLKKAGNLGLASYGVGFLTGGIVLLMPSDNMDIKGIVGVTGGLLSLGLAISAWNNIKLGGKYMNTQKSALIVSPSGVSYSYRF